MAVSKYAAWLKEGVTMETSGPSEAKACPSGQRRMRLGQARQQGGL